MNKFLIFFLILLCSFTSLQASPKKIVEETLALADIKINGDRPWDIRVLDDRFYQRIFADGSLGVGESYMEGWWDTPSLDECMTKILQADLENKVNPTWEMRWNYIKAKLFNMQEKGDRSKKVIQEHYELGDNLYENMLGNTLAYTCAYWKDANTLDQAQEKKFDLIARKVNLKPGMKVLDLGCGWGGFSAHIAKNYGVDVIAVNLSPKQCEYARKISAGLPVEVRNQDYRDVVGTFDRIISIGLMEHVGCKNYRGFIALINRCLKDDGLALIHTIGRDTSATTADPWISRYIFPHGHLPSIAQIGQSLEGLFVMEDWHNMSINYDTTLMAWYKNFEKNWPSLKNQYPDPFFRMWKYYLLSCAGGFRSRTLQLWQIVLSKKGVQGGYESIR
jgi:cyclopropane-fatty-acyl-phospholipid synthase